MKQTIYKLRSQILTTQVKIFLVVLLTAMITNFVKAQGPACAAPDLPVLGASSLTNCGTQNTTLTINSGSLNSATQWVWYSGSCGGTAIGTGTSVIVAPSATTTYFARGEGGCVAGGACTSITITVNPGASITCPANITVFNTAISCSAVVNYSVTSTGTVTYTFTGATTGSGNGNGSGSSFNTGTTNVTVMATGNCGTQSCSFTITVMDNILPTISCPAPLTVQCASAVPAPNTALVTASDNCSAVVTFVSDVISNQTCVNKYTITRTYKATDPSGNSRTCSQIITVNDNIAPHLIAALPGGPMGNLCKSSATPAPAEADIAALYTDNCSAVTATLLSSSITGSNCYWQATYTYRVKDACNNFAPNAVVIFTGGDIEAPQLTDILPGGYAGNVCKSGAPPPPSNEVIASKYTDNCSTVIATLAGNVVFGNDCNWIAIYTYNIKDDCENYTADAMVIYSGGDTEAPHLTGRLPGGNSTNACLSAATPAPPVEVIAAQYTDNCSSVSATLISSNVTGTDCNWTVTYTYSVADGCGNAINAVVTFTGGDTQAPTFTRPADITIPYTSNCSYNISVAYTGDVTNESDNCATGLQATYTDAPAVQCGPNTVIKRTWKLVDNCGNAAANQVQTITVSDNNTGYIVYATREAMFGENNTINGDVGVTAPNGKAEFKKGDVLNPFTVYAKSINVQTPSQVNNRVYVPATGGPNPPFMNYNGTGGSGNYTASANGIVNGNYKNLTIKKGVTATVTGNDFGTITIEEGAKVTFSSNMINVEELNVMKGKKTVTTNVYFSGCTGVKVNKKVSIDEECRVNVGGPKLTFYVGDTNPDEEKFTVNGNDTWITANMMIPTGKLQVHGGDLNCLMTGWYIVLKLNADGKNVIWNRSNCNLSSFANLPVAETIPVVNETRPLTVMPPEENFTVQLYPNPTPGDFNVQVLSGSNDPILVKVIDPTGVVMQSSVLVSKSGLMKIAGKNKAGTYFVEVTQGNNKKVLKLIKTN